MSDRMYCTNLECVGTSGKMAEAAVHALFGDKKFTSAQNPIVALGKSQEIGGRNI